MPQFFFFTFVNNRSKELELTVSIKKSMWKTLPRAKYYLRTNFFLVQLYMYVQKNLNSVS